MKVGKMLTLEEIKDWLRIESNIVDDDNLLNELIETAREEVRKATGKDLQDDNKLYNLAVKMLVGHWYDNRNTISDKQVYSVNYTVDSLITRLKMDSDIDYL